MGDKGAAYAARLRIAPTCSAAHFPPRAVATPLAFNSAAILRRLAPSASWRG